METRNPSGEKVKYYKKMTGRKIEEKEAKTDSKENENEDKNSRKM